MRGCLLACAALLVVCRTALADTYVVRNLSDSGTGSLRWAIGQANSHPGPDIVTFRTGLAGKVIAPSSCFMVFDDGTTIDGDLDDDGKPDIGLSAANLPPGTFTDAIDFNAADDCSLIGVAVYGFTRFGVFFADCRRGTVRSCHLGVTLTGNGAIPNTDRDLLLQRCADFIIGGKAATDRNIVAGRPPDSIGAGIVVDSSANAVISGNYFGIKRNGKGTFDAGGIGLALGIDTSGSTVGGLDPGAGNRFGGLDWGLALSGADGNQVQGNTFGLLPNGNSAAPIEEASLLLQSGAEGNAIGGTTAAARNVFACTHMGVEAMGDTTRDNAIRGNYFGLNVAGTRIKPVTFGVYLYSGPQVIGGNSAAAANYFLPQSYMPGWLPYGIFINDVSAGTVVKGNKFGVLPGGAAMPRGDGRGIRTNAGGLIRGNLFVSLDAGINAAFATATPRVLANTFRSCNCGVINEEDAKPMLGNLGNASAGDDGRNVFQPSNTSFIHNSTANRVLAEGNWFGTTVRSKIDAKIYDKLDNASHGRVDFIPLRGGVIPTGEAVAPALAITNATALPAVAGTAEIVFTLSAPADVTVSVLNLAGRPVATVARDLTAEAGPQRLVWSGHTLTGTRAPAGRYLVRIAARNAEGEQRTALCGVSLP